MGYGGRLDSAELRDADLIIGEQFQQVSFEFFVGAVDFIDQQYWRRRPGDRLQERTLQQIILAEHMSFLVGNRGNLVLLHLDGKQLTLIIPLINSRVDIQPFVTL